LNFKNALQLRFFDKGKDEKVEGPGKIDFFSKKVLVHFLKEAPLEKKYFLFYDGLNKDSPSTFSENFDFDYFSKIVQTHDSNSIALKIEKNKGQISFVSNGLQGPSLKRERLNEDHEDCYCEVGLSYLTGKLLIEALERKDEGGPFFQDHFFQENLDLNGVPLPRVNQGPKKPALFLDRDGVINEDLGYVGEKERIKFIEGVIDLIKFFNEKKWWVIVLTNQSGVARGLYTKEDVLELHHWMGEKLLEKGAKVDDWMFCPYHFEKAEREVYKKKSLFRKPHPGMMIEASEKYPIALEKSIMIGDKKSDVLFLNGVRYYLLQGHYPLEGVKVPCFKSHEDLLNYFRWGTSLKKELK
jgi:D,D-heptose 1,7-bisphosphate phosphatase